ncbi:MAG: glycerol-3-phosphate dehydrogenase/oxidase [Chloroflexi bacterium]|nr:glycerol-3-phosphate dehydrogenase/oxidase [Chloroflexota bacterium]
MNATSYVSRQVSRNVLLEKIESQTDYDIVIVGGGATGLGAAVDAAARGYKTLLLEAVDFAKGTSSRSTKLVHGGVRYLAQGNVSLVFEALRERGLLQRNAPHLCAVLPLIVPAYHWFDQLFYGTGLLLYSVLAGRLGFGFSRLVGRTEALRLAPTLQSTGLKGGVVYFDGQFDDARLAVTLLRTALDHGAHALNYARVVDLQRTDGRISGVTFINSENGETGIHHHVNAKVVINATGVFVDALRRTDNPSARAIVAPSQGVHIVLDRSFLPGDHAVMIPKTDDGRVLFAVPWHDRVVVGTTDTPVAAPEEEPRALSAEIEFLLSHASRYLSRPVTTADVQSIYAGQRPLVKAGDGTSTKSLSRDHTIMISDSGLVTITGGKWTTYRHMAEDVINRAARVGGLQAKPSTTENLSLHGATQSASEDPWRVYGTDAAAVQAVCAESDELSQRMHPSLPYLLGEAAWAARFEMARNIEDVLARRTRALLLNARASIEMAPAVAAVLARELGWNDDQTRAQVETYVALARGYLLENG